MLVSPAFAVTSVDEPKARVSKQSAANKSLFIGIHLSLAFAKSSTRSCALRAAVGIPDQEGI
jgi:predicted glycoside hydrolase/deacetylase ChbG (UPF0249 family)